MESLVVDSSVVVKWFVVEPFSTEARHILDAYQMGDLLLCAPDLVNAEVGNIVWKKRMFQGMTEEDALLLVKTFRSIPLLLTPTAELLEQALELAMLHQRTVYDMLYVALSLRIGWQLVTADEKLANAISSSLPNVVWLANWS